MQYIYLIFLIFFTTVVLFGCKKEERFSELQNYVTNVKQEATKKEIKQTSIPSNLKLPKPIVYQKGIPVSAEKDNQNVDQSKALFHPLQAYSLQSYQFVGTLSWGNEISAYVLAPDNKLYQVKKEDILGDQYGRVMNISHKELQILLETSSLGRSSKRVVTMKLKD